MSEGRGIPERLEHPDPMWWKRYEPITACTPRDACQYCGHLRTLHVNGCTARSTSLMGNPGPCDCTNTAIGRLYVDLSRLKPNETI